MKSSQYLGFAPEVQAAVDAIRSGWTSNDDAHHSVIVHYVPETFATAEAIDRYIAIQAFANAPEPKFRREPAFVIDNTTPQRDIVLPGQRGKPAKKSLPPVRPIGDVIREQLARIRGNW